MYSLLKRPTFVRLLATEHMVKVATIDALKVQRNKAA